MRTYEELRREAFIGIEKRKTTLFDLNKWIFDNPEVSGEEYEVSKKIAELLASEGFEVETGLAGFETAFRAKKRDKEYRRKAAVLLEYDALPGVGHAAGHCLSACMGLLGGLAFASLQEELECGIDFIGTPAEETFGSKAYMVDQGVFNDYDLAIICYPHNWNLVSPKLSALTSFTYNFHGKAAHAATTPWEGRNAFNAGQLFFLACNLMREQMTPDARVNGVFRETGLAANIVPDEASAEVYIRSTEKRRQAELINIVDECARGASIAMGTTWNKEMHDHPFDPMKPNAAAINALKEIYAELELELDDERDRSGLGSSDTGNVSFVCPTVFPCIETVPHDCHPHQREFANYMKTGRALEAMETGAKVVALELIKVFGSGILYDAVRADFRK